MYVGEKDYTSTSASNKDIRQVIRKVGCGVPLTKATDTTEELEDRAQSARAMVQRTIARDFTNHYHETKFGSVLW